MAYCKSEIKVTEGLVPSEGSREGLFQASLLTAGTSFCLWQCNSNLYMALCVCLSGSSGSLFYKVTSHTRLGPILMSLL